MRLPANFEIARELPGPGCSFEQAQNYTRWLARNHYENFTVASYLLPRALRSHFYNVYAYCRWADDLADEVPDSRLALELLDWWHDELQQCYAGSPRHAVFVALRQTIEQFDIPVQPFADLLTAFRRDQTIRRHPDWSAVIDYCRYSANPVGRLVLYLGGYRDQERQALSDMTCTALQLANFWQDVSRDLDKDRIYIPLDMLKEHGLSEEDLFSRRFDERYALLMRKLVAQTRDLFQKGLPLVERVSPELRIDIELFSRGGISVLDAIESIGYNTLQTRPSLSGVAKFRLLSQTYAKRYRIGRLVRALSQPRVGRSA
jgi:squalene synthase HpnC